MALLEPAEAVSAACWSRWTISAAHPLDRTTRPGRDGDEDRPRRPCQPAFAAAGTTASPLCR
jgi:hypothetical protein